MQLPTNFWQEAGDFLTCLFIAFVVLVVILGAFAAFVALLLWIGGPVTFFGGMFALLCLAVAWRLYSPTN